MIRAERRLAGFLSLLLGLAAGCGIHRHSRLGTSVDEEEIFSRVVFDTPVREPYARLHVAPTVFAEGAAVPLLEADRERSFSQEVFDRTLLAMLEATRGFQSVDKAEVDSADRGGGRFYTLASRWPLERL